jgi:DNA-binding GntR family transcriptional regulator
MEGVYMPRVQGFSQIKLASLNNECYIRIKDAILTGQFSWGDRLDVGQLANEFGISKFPVIKALDRLAIEHLVNIQPNKGTFVAAPLLEDIEEITEIRMMLETTTFDLACQKNLSGLIFMLEDVEKSKSDHFKYFREGQEFMEFLKYDRSFHQCFVTCSGNQRLTSFYEVIRSQVELFRTKTFYGTNVIMALSSHEKILSHLKKDEIPQAREEFRNHILQVHHDTLNSIGTNI